MGPELLTLTDRLGKEFCLQPTAEELITELVAHHSKPPASAFPLLLYQTTEKFRDEMNPRFGLLRGRQFLMNDLYSFDLNGEAALETYELVSQAYDRILKQRLGLNVFKVRADSGVHGGSLSHEYHLLNSLEEDAVEECTGCGSYSKAGETSASCCEGARRTKMSSIEVAHTFHLGSRYSEALGAAAGKERQPLDMCCFGIGVTRLMAAVVEWLSRSGCVDEPSIHLPTPIQPFHAAVILNKSLADSPSLHSLLAALPAVLPSISSAAPSVLLDDRFEWTLGRRVKYAEQIGLSRVIVLGKGTEKTLHSGPLYELWSGNPLKSEGISKRGDLPLPDLLHSLVNDV